MVDSHIFLIGLLVVSVITGLTTEAIKKIMTEHGKTYRANTLAGIVSAILSVATGSAYIILSGSGFNESTIICLIALIFMSWLCAMVGYDKVIQAISQFKIYEKKGDTNE